MMTVGLQNKKRSSMERFLGERHRPRACINFPGWQTSATRVQVIDVFNTNALPVSRDPSNDF